MIQQCYNNIVIIAKQHYSHIVYAGQHNVVLAW